MLLSELIDELTEILEENGNIEVVFDRLKYYDEETEMWFLELGNCGEFPEGTLVL
jgi:hypothetical protein